ncbi:MAG TPA: biopolymer transporter ExbD [Candidatus Acidoferrum sp.]|nr:biopolymer transporter ExbD [Candidatus Acidoferrum sp.]
MRMRRHGSEVHESSHGIDLAPMLDFVLNLLIFFIITAIFVKEVGLDVNRPNNTQQQQDNEGKAITIQVLETGEIFFNSRLVDVRAIRANVEREKALQSDIGVTIVADSKAQTGVIMGAVDQVRLGGIYNITFTTSQ